MVALVGANGAGKTTLLRLISGELQPHGGSVTVSGGLGVMSQFVGLGTGRDDRAGPAGLGRRSRGSGRPRRPWTAAEQLILTVDDEAAQMAYAQALSDWADVAGLRGRDPLGRLHHGRAGHPVRQRAVPRGAHAVAAVSRSGSCWRRCCAARTRCCCSTSRTTTSTSPASGGWRSSCRRPARPCCSSRTTGSCWPGPRRRSSAVEPSPMGSDVWVHGGGFDTYHEARKERFARFEELQAALGRGARPAEGAGAAAAQPGRDQPRHGLALPGDADPASRSSRRPGRRRSRRASRTSGCGCAAGVPACGR